MNPFENYKIYGPYTSKSENRKVIVLVHKIFKYKTSMSYARYLMSVQKGRWLEDWEEVAHINRNKLDDRIENLQIMTKEEHRKYDRPGRTMIKLICPFCKIEFEKEIYNTYLIKGGEHTFCSIPCARKYQFS